MASTETFVNPGSVLARTAREMVEAHAGGAGPREGMTTCPVCGQPLPCSSGRAAAEVLFAAGLAESSGLVAAYRQGLGSPAGSPFGLPEPGPQTGESPVPEPGPQAGASPFPAAADPPVVSFDKPVVSFDQPVVSHDQPVVSFDKPPHAEPSGPPAPTDAPADDVASSSYDSPAVDGSLSVNAVPGPAEPAAEGGLRTAQPAGPAPDDVPLEDEPSALSVPEPPAAALSRWASSRKSAKLSAVRASETPPPADTARGIARPISEPVVPAREPEPEVDPLLLGPPLFAQQNRPLDAPRFARTSRPAEPPSRPAEPPSGPAEPPSQPFAVTEPDAPPHDPAVPDGGRQDPADAGPDLPAMAGALDGREAPAGPDAFGAPASSSAADPSQAGGWPAPSGPLARQPGQSDQPSQVAPLGHPGRSGPAEPPVAPGHEPAGQGRADHPGVLDHPGEPGHPGVLDHVVEPARPGDPGTSDQPAQLGRPAGGPPSGRAPLEAPQMGQLNRGLAVATEKPATELGRQTTTAPQARPHRPPLEAPQLGQLNRPLEPADRQPIGDEPTGSGLPGRPAKAEPDLQSLAAQAPPLEVQPAPAPWAVGQDESSTPSGLSSPPPARPESPAAEQPADEDVPSGLPHRTDEP